MRPVTMQVVIPWWLTWIVAPSVLAIRQAGLISAETAAAIVAKGVRVEAI